MKAINIRSTNIYMVTSVAASYFHICLATVSLNDQTFLPP